MSNSKNISSAEQADDSILAGYAMRNADNGGRIHSEEPHAYRTSFQRDRDRIVHSKAFRRLGYKTQVFVNSEGDNYRTRLTHSLEVSQIARSTARALSLNCDYAETLALAHDSGHTPFGHAGQDALHSLMNPHGGFEHNCQSIRIVTSLESRYPQWSGLNLTRATLIGMMKHGKIYKESDEALQELVSLRAKKGPPLEAVLVDLCDRIAYLHHDLEDGLDAGYLTFTDVLKLKPLKDACSRAQQLYNTDFTEAREPLKIRTVLRLLLNDCITDLIEHSATRIKESGIRTLEDVYSLEKQSVPVSNSADFRDKLSEIHSFLKQNLYSHHAVLKMSVRGTRIIETLFHEYSSLPETMPDHVQKRMEKDGLFRVVSDYISGMTDRFAEKEFLYLGGRRRLL